MRCFFVFLASNFGLFRAAVRISFILRRCSTSIRIVNLFKRYSIPLNECPKAPCHQGSLTLLSKLSAKTKIVLTFIKICHHSSSEYLSIWAFSFSLLVVFHLSIGISGSLIMPPSCIGKSKFAPVRIRVCSSEQFDISKSSTTIVSNSISKLFFCLAFFQGSEIQLITLLDVYE